jgi:hypothetical protein
VVHVIVVAYVLAGVTGACVLIRAASSRRTATGPAPLAAKAGSAADLVLRLLPAAIVIPLLYAMLIAAFPLYVLQRELRRNPWAPLEFPVRALLAVAKFAVRLPGAVVRLLGEIARGSKALAEELAVSISARRKRTAGEARESDSASVATSAATQTSDDRWSEPKCGALLSLIVSLLPAIEAERYRDEWKDHLAAAATGGYPLWRVRLSLAVFGALPLVVMRLQNYARARAPRR